ncbi:hypothetical protein ACUTAF_03870 [Pseudomonas sp. SP16.1]|uniref:hypothetical protein n=1 Tax=Pseudomonas sp. SP16.1 TaxID=3458854 RepID=UPI00404557B6
MADDASGKLLLRLKATPSLAPLALAGTAKTSVCDIAPRQSALGAGHSCAYLIRFSKAFLQLFSVHARQA